MFNFFKKKSKEKTEYLGYYDTKPYDALGYSLIYAKNKLIYENEFVHVYSRNFRGTIFCITVVDDGSNILPEDYNYEKFKEEIHNCGIEKGNSVVNIMVYQHKTLINIEIAKKSRVNTKDEFNQVLIFDYNKVGLEYYRPVPKFYALYEKYAEAIFFDLTAIDPYKD